jgi:trans-aconitate methyltransferase
MMVKSSLQNRDISYGEQRKFIGLEAIAIRRRLKPALHLLRDVSIQAPEANVLELGCGFWGRNLNAMKAIFPAMSFTGVDLSVSAEESKVQLIQANVSSWVPNRQFDVALSLAVVEHLSDPQHHFGLLADCVKETGWIGLTTPTPQSHFVLRVLSRLGIFDKLEIDDHKSYLTRPGIQTLAGISKLTVEEFYTFSFGLNQWALLRKK